MILLVNYLFYMQINPLTGWKRMFSSKDMNLFPICFENSYLSVPCCSTNWRPRFEYFFFHIIILSFTLHRWIFFKKTNNFVSFFWLIWDNFFFLKKKIHLKKRRVSADRKMLSALIFHVYFNVWCVSRFGG